MLKTSVFVAAVFAVVYPTATLSLTLLSALVPDQPIAYRTLIMTGLMVPAMTLVITPAIQRTIERVFA